MQPVVTIKSKTILFYRVKNYLEHLMKIGELSQVAQTTVETLRY